MFVRGDELDIGGEDAQDRIIKAFQTLVDKVYTNLPMLRGVSYSEADINKAVQAESGLFGEDGGGVNEAEQDVLSFINAQARNGVKVSAKYLTERFTMKPYGWPTTAVLCLAGSLVAKGKIEARVDSTVTEGLDLAKALSNSHALAEHPADPAGRVQCRPDPQGQGSLSGTLLETRRGHGCAQHRRRMGGECR